jgi:protein gp37
MLRLAPWKRWPSNVWAGTTSENQKWFEKRIDHLLSVPAVAHFISAEPLLGPLRLTSWLDRERNTGRFISWVIAGGESGGKARHMNPDWVLSIRDQCVQANVPFLFKQWGNWRPVAAEEVNGYRSKSIFLAEI